jgi:hypothetical protein
VFHKSKTMALSIYKVSVGDAEPVARPEKAAAIYIFQENARRLALTIRS